MEERVLLTSVNYNQLPLDPAIQLNQIASDIQQTITSAEGDFGPILDHPLPIVGSVLGNAVQSLNGLAAKLNSAFSGQSEIGAIESALVAVLDPGGTGILPLLNGQFNPADEIPTPDSTTNPTELTRVEFKLPLADTFQVLNQSIASNIGLPALGLTTSGSIAITVGFTFNLDFGYDKTIGFFLDTTPNSGTSLNLTAKITLPGFTGSGTLGFLKLTATDHNKGDGVDGNYTASNDPNVPSDFMAAFNITFQDNDPNNQNLPSTDQNLVAFSDLGSDLGLNVTLSGDASLNLDLNLSFGGDTDFPSLSTMFHLDWPFSDSLVGTETNGTPNNTSTAGFGAAPTVAFDNVSLDMGSFFNNLVAPVVNDLNQIFAWPPLAKLLTFFNNDVPIINDYPAAAQALSSLYGLGSGPITFLEIANKIDPSSTVLQFIDDVNTIKTLSQEFGALTVSGTHMISLGSFDLGGPGDTNLGAGGDLRTLAESALNNVDLTDLPDAADLNTITQEYSDFAGTLASGDGDVGDFLSDLEDDVDGGSFSASFSNNGSLLFPILTDPTSAFGLLLGQNVNLMTFQMPTFNLKVPLDDPFQLGPVGVALLGTLDANDDFLTAAANLSGGYDTLGATEFVNSGPLQGQASDFFNGFYLNATGSSLAVNVGAAAEAYFGFQSDVVDFAGGVGGGISGSFTFDLNPVNTNQGRLRFSDIFGSNGDIANGDLFLASGEIDASFFAFVQIGVNTPFGFVGYQNHWNLASMVLISFGEPQSTSPISTSVSVSDSSAGNPIKTNQYESFNADVTSTSGGDKPLGSVDFNIMLNGITVDTLTEPLVNGVATVGPIQFTNTGPVTCTVSYTPSANTPYQPSSGQLGQNSLAGPQEVVGTIYVNENADGDGSSFADGFNTITQAINKAVPGDTIAVTEGVYQQPTIDLPLDVTLIGGFYENDTGSQPPNPFLYQTTLEGEEDSNEPVVAVAVGDDSSTILDGFTISSGSGANGAGIAITGQPPQGDGLISAVTAPVIENCIFQNNGASQQGGAVYCTEYASPTFVQCVFSGNGAAYGGAIYNSDFSNPSFINCTFSENIAGLGGGAIYNAGGDISLTNCIIWGNSGSPEIYTASGAQTNISYSDVEQSGYAGNNNVDANPNFVGGGGTAYNLQMPSLAIGTGNNAAIAGTQLDLKNNTRITPANGNVSMGAYQYQGPFVIYVDLTAVNGQNNGTSWANAFTNLSQALTYATVGFKVEVAAGDYGLDYPSYTIPLKEGVDLQGGYEDGGSSAPYPSTFVTYLDGAHFGNIFVTGAHAADTVVTSTGTDSSTILNGFTIENGSAQTNGGGMLLTDASPTITDCTFINNTATTSGGAIAAEQGSAPLISDCTFADNSASYAGGGIYLTNSQASLLNCAIRGNTSSEFGGGIYDIDSSLALTNCSFTANSSDLGGAISNQGSATITNCILWNDTAIAGFDEIYDVSGTSNVSYSDIEGGFAGSSNVNANPLFVSSTNLELQNGSAAIKAGSSGDTVLAEYANNDFTPTDLAGNPRFLSTTVDMGAYEFQGATSLVFDGEPPTTIASGSAFSFYLNLYQNNHLVVGDNSTVKISIASGPAGAILNGAATVQAQVIGGHQAQFNNITLTGPAGAYTLLATDGGDNSVTSAPFEVTASNVVSPTLGLGFIQEPSAVAADATMIPAVQVGVYLNGVLDTINNSQITLSVGGVDVASASVNNGVAYFGSLSFANPGTYSLTASLSNSNATIQSTSFTVDPAAPVYTLFVGPQPSNETAGNPFSISVTEKDQNGTQAFSDSTSQVSLSYTYTGSSGGTLTGTTPPETVNQGIANFTLTPSAAGAYLITASDGSDLTGNLGVNVLAPITYLVFTQEPGNVTIGGASAQFAVSVEQNNQVVLSDNSFVRVTVIQPNFADFGGTLNVQAVNGVATFNNYFLGNLPEGYNVILQATDLTNSNDVPTDSTSFQAFPAPPRNLTVRVSPTAPAGTSFDAGGFELTDAFGDVISDDASSVTASIGSGPAGATLGGTVTEPMNVGFNNLIITKAGTYGLQFTDATDGVTAFSAVTITSDGVPTQLAFVQQPNTVAINAGIEAPVAIALEDQYGNVVTTDNSDVVELSLASSTSAGATLGGPISVTAIDGVATFTGASLNATGSYTLGASSSNFSPVTSNSFNVVPPATIYVDQSAAGGDTGQDWPDAFTNLQSALAIAIPGDTIDVAQGDYSPGADPTDTFQLHDGVTVQGGFGASGFGGPDASTYPTTLDGMNTNYHVVTANGTDASAVLIGFTITAGNADSKGDTDSAYGGGLIADGGAPTITSCIFTTNTAANGGAIYIANQVSASATLTNCIFENNTASADGGAIYDLDSSPAIRNSQFLNNSTTGNGGAIFNQNSNATLVNCLFAGNVANQPNQLGFNFQYGGAIYNSNSSPTITNSTITGNSAIFGGAIFNDDTSSPILTNDILWNNNTQYAGNEIYGGGSPTVTNSIVAGGYTGAGNIDTDPLFVDAPGGDYELQPNSPAVNTGSATAPGLAGIATDLAGKSRFIDGTVDMGAFEVLTPTVTWTGADDGLNWTDPGNWSDDLIPTQNDNVIIPAGSNTVQIGPGAYTVASLTANSPVEVTSGTLLLNGQSTFNDGLTIDTGATVQVAPNSPALVVTDLSLTGGTLDLTNNSMIIHNGDLTALTTLIADGFHAGRWNGTGILSSTAAGTNDMALGIALNSGGATGTSFTTFAGQSVTSTDVLIRFTYFGDAELTGSVTAADYIQVDNAYDFNSADPATPLTGWFNGDFNYDGFINGDDYTLIDNAFNSQGSSAAVLAIDAPASPQAQIATPSSASNVMASGTPEARHFAALVSNPFADDDTYAQELKKRRPSAWEMLES
jgi:predicted outer membrane repeat protein